MPVYVDPLCTFGDDSAPACFRHKASCHMYADTLQELHDMANQIGLKRAWFQADRSLPHYDLTSGRRATALQSGALEHTRRQAVEKWRELRAHAVRAGRWV